MREKLKCFEYKVCENRNHTLLILKMYLSFYVLSVCLLACMYAMCIYGAHEAQKRASDLTEIKDGCEPPSRCSPR